MTQHDNAACISCGMPLRVPADHAAGDPAKEYCHYCAAPDGSLKSYDEVLAGMIGFLIRTQGLDEAAAARVGREALAAQPAWRG
jgi:hypothetical protein